MPGFICAVAICKSNSETAKKIGKHISFHSFPTDKLLQEEWVRRCYRKDTFDPKHKKICSEHFVNDDYEDAIQAKIMKVMPKRLKKDAIPTLNWKPQKLVSNSAVQSSERATKCRKIENVKIMKNVCDEHESSNPKLEQAIQDININDLPGSSNETDYDKLKRSYEALIEEHHLAKKQISELNFRNYNLQKKNEEMERNIDVHFNDKRGYIGSQILKDNQSKPQLVVLLNNNYGLPNDIKVQIGTEDKCSKNNTPLNVSNGNMNNLTKAPVNGTNISQIVNSNLHENIHSRSSSISEMINANALKILSVKQCTNSDRCRSCLSQLSDNYKKVTCPCYLDKTIKDAIVRLVPEIGLPIQDADVVCGKCFDILKQNMEFAFMFKRSENIIKNELHSRQKDALSETILLLNIPPRYTPLRDDFTLDVADKVISLSKIDNNHLTKFIYTLQRNQVKTLQYETNPFSRKRVLLLGNPKLRRCYVCYAKFLSESQLQDHLNSDHQITKEYLVKPIRHMTASEEEPLTCRACNKSFLSEFNLKSHLKWCISFPCPHCEDPKTFACEKLVEHTETVHGDKFPFKCCKCKKEFNEYKMYVKHNCKGHTCNTCGKKFQSTVALTYHIDRHKEVPCNIPFRNCLVCKEIVRGDNYSTHLLAHKKCIRSKCGKRFYKSESLEDHEKTHVRGPKTHKGKTCGKLFLKAKTLFKHQEIHQLTSKTICEICSKSFDSIKSLMQHKMNDHGDPNVTCELCGKECRPERLKQHIEMKHSSNPKHQCPLCSKSFVQLMQCKKHMEEVHTNVNNYPRSQIRKSTNDNAEKTIEKSENEEFVVNLHQQILTRDHGKENLETEESIVNEENNLDIEKEANLENSDENFKRSNEESNQQDIPFKRKKMFNFGVNISNGQMVCKYCLKSFSSQKTLKLHIQNHYQNKKSEKCTY